MKEPSDHGIMRQFNIGGSVGGMQEQEAGTSPTLVKWFKLRRVTRQRRRSSYLTGDDEVPDKPSEKRTL